MNSRQLVLTGLVITSLVTSLSLSGFMPVAVTGGIILLAGLICTFYAALHYQRVERIKNLELLIKAGESLAYGNSITEILNILKNWAVKIVPCDYTGVWSENGDWYNVAAPWDFAWEKLQKEMVKNGGSLIINRDKGSQEENGDYYYRSLLCVPLNINGEIKAILYFVNQKDKIFSQNEKQLAERLAEQAAVAIERCLRAAEEREFLQQIIKSLVRATEAGKPLFTGHSERVTEIARLIGEKLALDQEEFKVLEYSAVLHDMGKSGILTGECNEKDDHNYPFDPHPLLGADLLPDTGIYAEIKKGILYHHERYDGSGYPEGLSHTEIPFVARIIAVADVYDALTHICSEEERLYHDSAVKVIKKATGTLFDPLVVVGFEEVETEIKARFTVQEDED